MEMLNILSEDLNKIANLLKDHVSSNNDVFIKFHYDADGISSFLMLNNSLKAFIRNKGFASKIFYSPNKKPFYDVSDLIKDLSNIKRLNNPLILIVDFGMQKSFEAYKILNSFGLKIILIDHHLFDKIEFNKNLDLFEIALNPFMKNLELNISAGALCYEIANKIYYKNENLLYNLISLVGDKCEEGREFSFYNKGHNLDYLKDLALAFDYIAFNSSFNQELFISLTQNKLFLDNLLSAIHKEIISKIKEIKFLEYNLFEDHIVLFTKLDNLSYGFPPPHKLIGIFNSIIKALIEQREEKFESLFIEHFSLGNPEFHNAIINAKSAIVIGQLNNSYTIRIYNSRVTLQDIIEKLNAEGGGHKQAGSLRLKGDVNLIDSIKKVIEEKRFIS